MTHDQVEALALADRVAVMSQAELQQVGTRNDLYHRPANVFVADFIGEPPTNFFRVRLHAADGAARLHAEDSDLVFEVAPERAARLAETGVERFIAGLRPQNLHLDGERGGRGGQGGRSASVAAEVAISEYVGERVILTLGNGRSVFRALAAPDTRAARGEAVRMHYAPQDVMVFSESTEELIA